MLKLNTTAPSDQIFSQTSFPKLAGGTLATAYTVEFPPPIKTLFIPLKKGVFVLEKRELAQIHICLDPFWWRICKRPEIERLHKNLFFTSGKCQVFFVIQLVKINL